MFSRILNTLVTRVLSAAASLLIAVVISRYLGADGKGEQSLIITTIVMIMLASNLLAGAALVYLSPRLPLWMLVVPATLWSVLVGALSYGLLLFLPIVPFQHIFDVAALSVISAFCGIMVNLLIGQERISLANMLNLLQPGLTLSALLLTFWIYDDITINTYVKALYLAFGVPAIFGLWSLRRMLFNLPGMQSFTWSHVLGKMWHYGLLNQLSHVFQLMSFRLGYYFLDAFAGTASLGKYSNAVAIMESIWLISKSIAVVQYARIANSNDNRYKQALTLELARFTSVVSLMGVIVLCLLPGSTYIWLFGEEFTGIPGMMLALAPGILCFSLVLIFGHYFSGNGQYSVNTRASIAGFLVMLISSLLLIPHFGAYGAGASASLSYMVTASITLWFFYKQLKFTFRDLLAGPKDIRRFLASWKVYVGHHAKHPEGEHDASEG